MRPEVVEIFKEQMLAETNISWCIACLNKLTYFKTSIIQSYRVTKNHKRAANLFMFFDEFDRSSDDSCV